MKTRKGKNSEKERRIKKELKERWKNKKKKKELSFSTCKYESPGSP